MTRGRGLLTFGVLLAAVCGGLGWAGPDVALAGPAQGDQAAVVAGNTEFAMDLYAKLRTGDGNLLISPYSISTALAMAFAGARGDTATQMADVLNLSQEQDRLHPAFAALGSSVEAAGKGLGCSLHVANALWGQQGEGFLKEFLTLTKKHYGSALRELDFQGAADPARETINAWALDQTQQKVKDLLRREDVGPATALLLTNAIYFKGNWASQFDRHRTKNAPFRLGEGEQVLVPMMDQHGKFAFAAAADLSVLALPYDGDRLSMVFLLPPEVDGLAALEASLSRESLDQWVGRLRRQPVSVKLPRLELGSRFDLTETLEAMGMPDAFNGKTADFSGMNGRRHDLFLMKVIHQTQVDVNEEGTEAAAATAVTLGRGGPRPASFIADHPFLFLIRDKLTGSILFMGRVMNPKA